MSSKKNNMNKKERKKVRRVYTKHHSKEMLELALECMKKKELSSYQAEKQFGIPRRTLLDKLHGLHNKAVGCPTRLRDSEESQVVKTIIAAADFGCPLNLLDLRIMVYNYLQKNGRDVFNGKLPGKKWAYGFIQRHRSSLSLRVTQNIKKARAEKSCTELRIYFNNLKETLENIPPENICNYDETNLSDDPGKAKCIFKRGTKYPERILNHSKGAISIMFAITASGEFLAPFTVYKSKQLWSQWVTGGPPKAFYNNSSSGWFDASLFEEWFVKVIIPWAKKLSGPKVVIGDNLASHINPNIVNLCEQHNIRFVLLPTNSTHLTQPLDVCVYGPLKKLWRKIILNYKIQNPSEKSLNKCHFPQLLDQLLKELMQKKDNAISAFVTTGIYPFNPERVLKRLPDFKHAADYGIDQALLDYLKETRTPKTKNVNKGQNKKIKIQPGTSVSAEDFPYRVSLDFKLTRNREDQANKTSTDTKCKEGTSVTITSNVVISTPIKNCNESDSNRSNDVVPHDAIINTPKKNIIKRNLGKENDSVDNKGLEHTNSLSPEKYRRKDDSEDDDDGEDYSVHDSSSSYAIEDDVEEIGEGEIENTCVFSISSSPISLTDENQYNLEENETISIHSYLLVKFILDKGTKLYIGQVLEKIDNNAFKVKFLRRKGNGKFAWPIIDDISTVYLSDIEKILPNPRVERRGIVTFKLTDLDKYKIN